MMTRLKFGTNFVHEKQVEEQAQNMDAYMVDTHHDDDQDWQHVVDEHEDP